MYAYGTTRSETGDVILCYIWVRNLQMSVIGCGMLHTEDIYLTLLKDFIASLAQSGKDAIGI